MLRGLYIYVIKSLKGRSILPTGYTTRLWNSAPPGFSFESFMTCLSCQSNQLWALGSFIPLLIIVNKELNKPLQGMAPTLMPSKCPLTSGMLACSLEEFHTHGRTYILTSVGAKNKFAITSMSSSQVHKIVKELKWTLQENSRWGPRCMRWLRRGATSSISYHFGPKEKEISWMAQKCQIF